MEQTLAARDDRLGIDPINLADPLGLPLVESIPLLFSRMMGVNLAVHITDHAPAALGRSNLGNHLLRLAGLRVECQEVTVNIARTEVDPALVVCGDVARVLTPILLMKRTVILELLRRRIVGHEPAVGIRDRPDPPTIVLRHTHRHLPRRLVKEGELPFHRIELGKMAIEVRVVPVARREDRRVRTIAPWRKGRANLPALSGLRINHQQRIPAPMIEKPNEHHIPPLPINSRHRAPVITDRRRNAMVLEAVTEIFGCCTCRVGDKSDCQNGSGKACPTSLRCHVSAPFSLPPHTNPKRKRGQQAPHFIRDGSIRQRKHGSEPTL
jgi:hypothetical protein